MEKNYFLPLLNDSIKIETLKFYISDFELLENKKIIYSDKKRYHLLDFENENSMNILTSKITIGNYNVAKFMLGIDSATNVSGAMGGDLDPTKGMYWTWQSGYINIKLEGKSKVCRTRNHEFQFHIGGYLPPHKTIQEIFVLNFCVFRLRKLF